MGKIIIPEDINGVITGTDMKDIYNISELVGNIIMIRNLNKRAIDGFALMNKKLTDLLASINAELSTLKK